MSLLNNRHTLICRRLLQLTRAFLSFDVSSLSSLADSEKSLLVCLAPCGGEAYEAYKACQACEGCQAYEAWEACESCEAYEAYEAYKAREAWAKASW